MYLREPGILVEVLEAVEKLLEVEQHFFLGLEPSLLPLATDEALQVFIVAVLQDQVDAVVLAPDHVLHLYYVLVLPQPDQ